MTPEVALELIKIIPTILWIAFLAITIVVFHKPMRYELLPRLGQLKTSDGEELPEVPRQGYTVTEKISNQAMRRAQRIGFIWEGARLLLVNDIPEEMAGVCKILRSLGISVDIARTTEAALSMMEQVKYDLVLSVMRRDEVPDEGLHFLDETIKRNIHRLTIFTVAQLDPSRGVPAYAFGITNRVDKLLNLILDALERERG